MTPSGGTRLSAYARSVERAWSAYVERPVLLFSGGISMGDYDLVPGILVKNGVEILVRKIATKPGKPTLFGRSSEVFCFGLAGNPVATFVIFERLVRPCRASRMGHACAPVLIFLQ